MCSSGKNGEGELRGQLANQVHLEKWPLKWSVCVCVLHSRFGQKVSSFLLKLNDTDVNVHTKQQYNNTLLKPHNVSLIIYLYIIMHNTTTIYCSRLYIAKQINGL